MTSRESEFCDIYLSSRDRQLRLATLLTGGDRVAADELVQDAFVELYARWRAVRDPNARGAYVRQVVVRKFMKSAKRARTEISEHTLSDGIAATRFQPAIAGVEEEIAATDQFWTWLRTLSPRQRSVLALRYYADLTDEEIAEHLGTSVGTVKSHGARGLQALRSLHLSGTELGEHRT